MLIQNTENQTTNNPSENLAYLQGKVKELLEYKRKFWSQNTKPGKRLQTVKSKKDNKLIRDYEVSAKEMEQIDKDFIKLNSEFQLLKLCQRNLTSITVELKAPERDLNKMKCNDCDLKFKTENG